MRCARRRSIVLLSPDGARLVVSQPRPASPRALSPSERETVLAHLHEERFQDCSPAAVQATLLDEGVYHCSIRTMYRILEQHAETRERRDQRIHPAYQKPELLATAPNELWSWDITKLMGPAKWTYFYLYVILDVFSRYVVGWMVAPRESAELARKLIEDTCSKQQIQPGQLTIHADRGSSMTSKPVAFLLADLGVTKTHSRPYVSDDNPYSESQFRTLKYRPDFPDRFGSIQDSRSHSQIFFPWYNEEHRHSGIGCSPRQWSTMVKPLHSLPEASTRPRCRLPGSPGTLRPLLTQTTRYSKGGLDQQTHRVPELKSSAPPKERPVLRVALTTDRRLYAILATIFSHRFSKEPNERWKDLKTHPKLKVPKLPIEVSQTH